VRRAAPLALTAGTAVCVLGLSRAHAAAHGYDFATSSRFGWSVVFVATLVLGAYGFGLPDGTRTRRAAVLAAVGATTTSIVVVSLTQLLVGDALLPRAVVLGSVVILLPWYLLCARLAGDAFVRDEVRDRVVVVSSIDDVDALRTELDRAPEHPALLVGTLTSVQARATDPPERPLVATAERAAANVVVLDREAQADEDIVTQAALLHERGVRIRTLSLFYEQWLGKLPVNELERVSLLFDIGEVHAPAYSRVKRLLDIVLAGAGAVVLVLVIPFVAAANRIANRGPLLFRQRRVGRGGNTFEILKFRTMSPATPPTGDPTVEADPRITRFGGALRRIHLDELPQVVNILRGELSVVGPRPEQPHLATRLAEKIPFYRVRHLVRPGLTGWAQVKYHYGADDLDALEKLQYEVYYLRRQGIALDLRIVARTVRSVVARGGR
jgi:lipopolysaccharide/colanic/teichoic acid biosynthesis glycosyltransferase